MQFIKLLLISTILVSCNNETNLEPLTIYTSRQPQLIEPLLKDKSKSHKIFAPYMVMYFENMTLSWLFA